MLRVIGVCLSLHKWELVLLVKHTAWGGNSQLTCFPHCAVLYIGKLRPRRRKCLPRGHTTYRARTHQN